MAEVSSPIDVDTAGKWLIPIRKEVSPQTRLLTFHWVGGNGFVFRSWRKELPGNIDIYSMMMPGRLSRRKETFVESVDAVVHQLLLSMQALGLTGEKQPPTVFFGHSYGGIIAYELARALQKQGLLSIAHLVVSSTNCPRVLTARSLSNDDIFYRKFYQLSDSDLLHELINQGALKGGVHIDILQASLPIIRADYKGLETYISANPDDSSPSSSCRNKDGNEDKDCRYRGHVTVWGGSDDLHNVSEESLLGWRDSVASEQHFSFRLFKGSHFYFVEPDAKDEFMEALIGICLNCGSTCPAEKSSAQ